MLPKRTALFLLPRLSRFSTPFELVYKALIELQAACLILLVPCTALVIKIQEAGSKDDIKVPLRVLRDEIGRAFFSGCAPLNTPSQPIKESIISDLIRWLCCLQSAQMS